MKYRTEVVREGELLGPIDWDYNFRQHFESMTPESRQDEYCKRAVDLLRQIESDPESYLVTLAHGSVERSVYSVGMYDGWPYWRPTPALLTSGTLCPEWHFFYDLQAVRRKVSKASEVQSEG